ncbi:MAG: glycosyltransferase [Bacteroidota bacterium]
MIATIILPTTGDRGSILKFSVTSILQQSEEDWELFIIGDGVNEDTRKIAQKIANSDSRIQFFDFPKDESRGELRRHDLLINKAKGEIVCYLCDRDLFLYNHVKFLYEELQKHDFVNSMGALQYENGDVACTKMPASDDAPAIRAKNARVSLMIEIPLSLVAHRLDAYKKLPHGWRVTPKGLYTDSYMWQQFYAEDWVKTSTLYRPTVIYLKRGDFPGLSTAKRMIESERFFEIYKGEEGEHRFLNKFIEGQYRQRQEVSRKLQEASREIQNLSKRVIKYKKLIRPYWKSLFK